MKKVMYTRGAIPIIAIIAFLVALGGVGAVLMYANSNQTELEGEVAEVREEGAQQAQAGGYPSVWVEENLPQYPGAELTKTREGKSNAWGAQVTFETTDSLADVQSYFVAEMTNRGYASLMSIPANDFSFISQFRNGDAVFNTQGAKIGDGPKKKVILIYGDPSKI